MSKGPPPRAKWARLWLLRDGRRSFWCSFFPPCFCSLFWLIFGSKTAPKKLPKWPPGARKSIKKSLPTEKCEKLKFATPQMVFIDFWGLEGPFGDSRALQVTYFFDSRHQHDFGVDFGLKMDPFLEPFGVQMATVGLRIGGPGTNFGHFWGRRAPKAHFEVILGPMLGNCWLFLLIWDHFGTCFCNFQLPNRNVEQVTSKHQPGKQEYNQRPLRTDDTARRNARSD